MPCAPRAHACPAFPFATERLPRQYVCVFKKVHKALNDEWDEADAERAIGDDWERDVQRENLRSTGQMGRAAFMDSVFEVAWLPSRSTLPSLRKCRQRRPTGAAQLHR